jgi:hypothetical protein
MHSSRVFENDRVGNIFKLDTFPGLKTISRVWHFIITDEGVFVSAHKIVFRHSLYTGNWILILDGRAHMKGFEAITNRNFEIIFEINSHEAVITAIRKGGISMSYSHCFLLEERVIQEIKRSDDNLNIAGDGEEGSPQNITIPDCRTFNDGAKDVTLYQICITYQDSQIIVEKRFSEFIALNMLISAVKDKFSGVLPLLPPKIYGPWIDQKSGEFVDLRRKLLQKYLEELLANVRIRTYTEFLCFLGLHPITGKALQQSLLRSFSDDDGFQI